MATREAAAGGGVARVRIASAGGEGAGAAVVDGAAVAAAATFASGRGTETATALDVSGAALPASAANEQTVIARRQCRRDDDELARGVGRRLGDRLAGVAQLDPGVRLRPAGDDRFARRLDVHHVEGRLERRRRPPRSRPRPPGAEALAAGGAVWTAGAAGGTVGVLGSGALATTWVAAGLGQRNPGWVHSSAPATAPAATTVDAVAPPTQTSVFCDSMLARLRAGLYRESDHGDKCLSPFLHARGLHIRGDFRLREGDARFLRRRLAAPIPSSPPCRGKGTRAIRAAAYGSGR